MADNDTPRCHHCGTTLDLSRPYTVRGETGSGWEASHDDCRKAMESWAQLAAVHQGWCHAADCDRGPIRPFSRE